MRGGTMRVLLGVATGIAISVTWHTYHPHLLVWLFSRGDTP